MFVIVALPGLFSYLFIFLVQFVCLICACLDLSVFLLYLVPLGVWEGLWFVIVALPGLFSYLL